MFNEFQIIGHRGFNGKYDENTIESFTKARDVGATMIEFDVQLAGDYSLCVFHDKTTGRLCNADLTVRRSSKKELQSLNYPITFLEDLFDTFGDTINYYVELKTFDSTTYDDKNRLVFYTINEIVKRGLKQNCLLCSFDPDCLRTAKRLGYTNLGEILSNQLSIVPTKVKCPIHKLIKGQPKQLTFAWTVNNKRRMKTLIKSGVNGIVTDYPDKLVEVYSST